MEPIVVIPVLALLGAFAAMGLLRALSVSWKWAVTIVLVVTPIALALGGALTYAMVTLVKSLQLEVSGLVFGALATLVVAAAGGVAMSRNILYSGFFLMGTLVGVAGLYLFIGADFVGIAQLLIYIGGILVLLLFAVLLTNRIGAVDITNMSVGILHRLLAGGVAGLVFLIIAGISVKTAWPKVEAVATPTTARMGDAFLREYLLPFELISVVLLMALVGAMVIARRAAKDPGALGEAPGLERLE